MKQIRPALETMLQAQVQEPKDKQASGICQGPVHAALLKPMMHVTMFMSSLNPHVTLMLVTFVLQIQTAVQRLAKTIASTSAGAAHDQQQPVPVMMAEAPEDVHLRKRIKLQPGWLYHSSPDGVDENLLILLHGYGDTPGMSHLVHMIDCLIQCCLGDTFKLIRFAALLMAPAEFTSVLVALMQEEAG